MKKQLLILTSLVLCLSVIVTRTNAQCDDPLPQMFVKKDTGMQHAKEFSDDRFLHTSKFTRLKKSNSLQKKIYDYIYSWDAINDLLDKIKYPQIRAHFARFSAPCPRFPDIKDTPIVLLFSAEGLDPSEYFILRSDNIAHPVTKADATKWIEDFNTINQPILRKTIRKKDLDNYEDEVKSKEFSDTRSILYERSNLFDAFIKEKEHQIKYHKISLDSIGVQFSAYTKKGRKATTNDRHRYRRRLFVQFDYLQNTSDGPKPFYLDDQSDYECRLRKNVSVYDTKILSSFLEGLSLKQVEEKMSSDNGQLCPTYCPK
jgi:hypothetical protein